MNPRLIESPSAAIELGTATFVAVPSSSTITPVPTVRPIVTPGGRDEPEIVTLTVSSGSRFASAQTGNVIVFWVAVLPDPVNGNFTVPEAAPP